MAGEHLVWNNMRDAMRSVGAIGRVENAVAKGWPDVSGAIRGIGDYWVELKGLMKWPRVPEDRIIHLDHDLTLDQRLWLKERWLNDGNCWVLLGIRDPMEWLMWDGFTAGEVVGRATLPALRQTSVFTHMGKFPTELFTLALKHRAKGLR